MSAYDRDDDRFQVPLMFAFREAHRDGDATKSIDETASGERVLAERRSLHRRGAAESALRNDVSNDLLGVMDTINLASARDLSNAPYVAASVLNYGLTDNSNISTDSLVMDKLAQQLRQSLLTHEPRLRSDSLVVERSEDSDMPYGRVRFLISAEMRANPVDVPVEFVAEIDVGSGKMSLPNLAAPA